MKSVKTKILSLKILFWLSAKKINLKIGLCIFTFDNDQKTTFVKIFKRTEIEKNKINLKLNNVMTQFFF